MPVDLLAQDEYKPASDVCIVDLEAQWLEALKKPVDLQHIPLSEDVMAANFSQLKLDCDKQRLFIDDLSTKTIQLKTTLSEIQSRLEQRIVRNELLMTRLYPLRDITT